MSELHRPPKRVLHVLNSASGGAALSTLALIQGLKKLGVDSAAVCHDVGSAEEREALRDACDGNVEFAELYWWNKKNRATWWKRPALEALQLGKTGLGLGSTLAVGQAARKFGAELIHSNTVVTVEGGRAAQALTLPHVWHVRELLGTLFELPLEGRALGKRLEKNASVMVANSQATAAPLEGLLPADRLTVIYNGLQLDELLALPAPTGPITTVVMIANLTSRWKKPRLFIEVGRRLRGKARFVLYGQGAEQRSDAYIGDVIQAAEEAGVELGGFKSPREILAGAELLVHPVDQESFGRTVVEAMAASRAVVGVEAGGLKETVVNGETGILVPTDDVDRLTQATQALIDDPERAHRLGAAGRIRAAQNFSIDGCATQLLEVYRRAMAFPLWSGWSAVSALLAG